MLSYQVEKLHMQMNKIGSVIAGGAIVGFMWAPVSCWKVLWSRCKALPGYPSNTYNLRCLSTSGWDISFVTEWNHSPLWEQTVFIYLASVQWNQTVKSSLKWEGEGTTCQTYIFLQCALRTPNGLCHRCLFSSALFHVQSCSVRHWYIVNIERLGFKVCVQQGGILANIWPNG